MASNHWRGRSPLSQAFHDLTRSLSELTVRRKKSSNNLRKIVKAKKGINIKESGHTTNSLRELERLVLQLEALPVDDELIESLNDKQKKKLLKIINETKAAIQNNIGQVKFNMKNNQERIQRLEDEIRRLDRIEINKLQERLNKLTNPIQMRSSKLDLGDSAYWSKICRDYFGKPELSAKDVDKLSPADRIIAEVIGSQKLKDIDRMEHLERMKMFFATGPGALSLLPSDQKELDKLRAKEELARKQLARQLTRLGKGIRSSLKKSTKKSKKKQNKRTRRSKKKIRK